jgi:desampylase
MKHAVARLAVSRTAVQAMLDHAAAAAPDEACGLLLGTAQLVQAARAAPNVAPSPRRHFEVDPQVLIDAHRAARAGGPGLAGYYHSHPGGLPEPSATDRREASGDGRIWAIVADGRITWWRDAAGGFEPLSYRLVDL